MMETNGASAFTFALSASNPNHRRRRGTQSDSPPNNHRHHKNGGNINSHSNSNSNTNHNHNHYYDDSDDDDDKGRRHDEDRIFQGSCSFGQFVLNPCLCLFNTAVSCIRRSQSRVRHRKRVQHQQHQRQRPVPLLLLLLLLVLLLLLLLLLFGFLAVTTGTLRLSSVVLEFESQTQTARRFLTTSSVPTFLGRPLTDRHADRILVAIPSFAHNGGDGGDDIGGWAHLRRFFRPSEALDPVEGDDIPNFGGLDMIEKQDKATVAANKNKNNNNNKKNSNNKNKNKNKNNSNKNNNNKTDAAAAVDDDDERAERMRFSASLHSPFLLSPERVIDPEDERLAEEYWEDFHDDDHHVHSYDMYPEELEDEEDSCWFVNWAKKYYPQCNGFHEITLNRDYDSERAKRPGYDYPFDNFYISHGYYRDVWVINQHVPENVKTVIKMSRYKHSYNKRNFWNTVNDALVMERLSVSPRIVDIYGHCGYAVWVEAISHEVEEVIIKGEGMAKQKDLYKNGLESLNEYTIEEKLDMALAMAESLADLHGFKDGVIVHDDVQLCQWLKTADGRLKLGDFNRAEVMEWNSKKKKYCRYYNGDCGGNYRAPEEYDQGYLNEQIDVYSFGNNIYGLLTGLWVFYDTDDDATVQKKVINGTRAFIDPRWKERSFIESKLVEVMERCWLDDPNERMDIFQAVKRLREIKEEHERGKQALQ